MEGKLIWWKFVWCFIKFSCKTKNLNRKSQESLSLSTNPMKKNRHIFLNQNLHDHMCSYLGKSFSNRKNLMKKTHDFHIFFAWFMTVFFSPFIISFLFFVICLDMLGNPFLFHPFIIWLEFSSFLLIGQRKILEGGAELNFHFWLWWKFEEFSGMKYKWWKFRHPNLIEAFRLALGRLFTFLDILRLKENLIRKCVFFCRSMGNKFSRMLRLFLTSSTNIQPRFP